MDWVVETKKGKIIGEKEGNLIVFKGVPYAEPPTGPLRWQPPMEKKTYEEIVEAKSYGCVCPQPEFEFFKGMAFREKQSEDCLYLNIYTPGIDGKKRPVMIWIHGGAFVMGSSSYPLYRKGKLSIRSDVVTVTINYRLGPFGFLRLKDITGGKIDSTGNEGLLDQILAIKWVKENIEFFGGDPENITLFGESAGAVSIACILAMDGTLDLFQKIIMQSANPEAVFEKSKSNQYAKNFLECLNLNERDVEKLRSISCEELVLAEEELLKKTGEITVFSPNVDGEYLKYRPADIQGIKKSSIPLLIGTNLNEWNFFYLTDPKIQKMDMEDVRKIIQMSFPGKKADMILNYYYNRQKSYPWEIYCQFMTDTFFLLPTIRFVEKWISFDFPVFFYLFEWPSPYLEGKLGACHTLELGFLFGNYDERFFGKGKEADELSRKMQDAWTSFARFGDPSCESIGEWPDYRKEKKVMILGKECYLKEDPHREKVEFYSSLED